jgi:hypothetical protein
VAKLAGKSWMFQTTDQVARIRMCDDCRVISQFEAGTNPFALGERPKPRTSEDYLRERDEAAAARRRSGPEGTA